MGSQQRKNGQSFGVTVFDVGIIDFDTSITWERSKMKAAKMALDQLGATWKQSGRGWLKIQITPHAALYFAPGTGSLRFEKGKIFSSRGLPFMLEIVAAYR
jgi:hypothetical protein